MRESVTHADSTTGSTPRLFERVLCAIDGKAGGFAAIQAAAGLMGRGGEMTLLVVTSFRHQGDRGAPAIGPVRAKQIVDRAQAIANEAGVRAHVEVEPAAPPAEVVLSWAAEHELLAIGAPASSRLGGMLVAGVADSAVGSAPTAVLAVRADSPRSGYGHILVASDGREDSLAPLACAGMIARAHGSRLTVLHALEHRRGHTEQVLAQAARLRESGTEEPDVLLRRGSAHDAIVESAERLEASLVIVGSRRLAGARALGSVSRRVVHEAGCSVLVVPPESGAWRDEEKDDE